MRLHVLAEKIGAELVGDGSIDVTSCATLESAAPHQLTFVSNAKYQKRLASTRAAAVVVSRRTNAPGLNLLKAADPYFAFQQAVVILHGFRKHPHVGIHPNATVDPTATIGPGTIVYPGVFVGPRVRIGRDCILFPNTVIYDDCVIGDRVTIHASSTIGVDGFGYATHAGVHHKIPQIGNVLIEDDVEIGANCTIERGALDSTVIGKGTKIDGLVCIGHGAKIGAGCLLVAQVGIAGSATLGNYVVLGGQVGVAGHLTVGDGTMVGAQSGITNDVPPNSKLLGSPAMDIRRVRRIIAIMKQLPEISEKLKRFGAIVEESETSSDEPA